MLKTQKQNLRFVEEDVNICKESVFNFAKSVCGVALFVRRFIPYSMEFSLWNEKASPRVPAETDQGLVKQVHKCIYERVVVCVVKRGAGEKRGKQLVENFEMKKTSVKK